MSYHHLSTFERGRIEELWTQGLSNRAIAKRLGRHRSCIDREWNRNKTETSYTGVSAEFAYRARRRNSKPNGKQSEALLSIIEEKLLATWSPEQIANTEALGIVSFKTIYNWLYVGKLHGADNSICATKESAEKQRNTANLLWEHQFLNVPKK